jgi:magnesium transporter
MGMKKKGLIGSQAEREKKATKILVFDYDKDQYTEKDVPLNQCEIYKHKPTVTWLNFSGTHNHEAVKRICECYQISSSAYEKIIDNTQRPRIEDYGIYLFITMKMFLYDKEAMNIISEQVNLVIGKGYVITFQERSMEEDVFDPIRKRIRTAGTKIRQSGSDYLAYRLIDAIIDYYFAILEIMGEQIEKIEQETISYPTSATLMQMQKTRRDLIYLRKSIWPVREIMNSLQRGESGLMMDETQKMMRNLYEHTIQIMDAIEALRDTMSSLLDIYLSSVSNRLNEIVKVLTMISTIFMPLTFIVGIYGMNFKYMPEINSIIGYPIVMSIMLLISATMLFYFKRKKWL